MLADTQAKLHWAQAGCYNPANNLSAVPYGGCELIYQQESEVGYGHPALAVDAPGFIGGEQDVQPASLVAGDRPAGAPPPFLERCRIAACCHLLLLNHALMYPHCLPPTVAWPPPTRRATAANSPRHPRLQQDTWHGLLLHVRP